jgi:tripartite-type tricarboxylate transporter receptor subunit TctC
LQKRGRRAALPEEWQQKLRRSMSFGISRVSSVTIQAAVPHGKTGRLKALPVGGLKRNAIVPDVPTRPNR